MFLMFFCPLHQIRHFRHTHTPKIKGPENPTCQLLPMIIKQMWKWDGKGRKERRWSKTGWVKELFVTVLRVCACVCVSLCKSVVCERVVCDNVVCKSVVCERVVCDKVVCERVVCVCDKVVCVWKNCVWQSCVWKGCVTKKLCVKVDVAKSMSPSATHATQSEGRCRQVPRLPRKQPRRPRRQLGTNRATRASPVPQVPCLPRKVKVDVAKCHACRANSGSDHGVNWEPSSPPEPSQCHKYHTCHAKCTSMSPSATAATQSDHPCRQVPRLPRKVCVCGQVVCVRKLCVSKLCGDKLCVEKLCGSKLCVDKLCVSKLCVSKLCGDKLCEWASCVLTSCVWVSCVWATCVWASCVWASCVWVSCVWAAGGSGSGQAEVQNQKQEPHTKMWGKTQIMSSWLQYIKGWSHQIYHQIRICIPTKNMVSKEKHRWCR